MKRTYFLMLTVLAAFGFAPLTARAQTLTLNSGDNVTVSGAGTVGTIGGAPVANTTTSYIGDTSTASTVRTNGTAVFVLGPGGSVASKSGYYLNALNATGSGNIAINGGTLSNAGLGDDLHYTGSGSVTISGGTFSGTNSRSVYSSGSGTVSISGGSFRGAIGITNTAGSGAINISGGTIVGTAEALSVGGTINVTGGSFSLTSPFGSVPDGFYVTGTLNLFSFGGSPFLVNGVPMNNTSLDHFTTDFNSISGTLLNGDILNIAFKNPGTINLNVGTPPVTAPEPSSLVALAVGVLSLCTLALRARKRSAA